MTHNYYEICIVPHPRIVYVFKRQLKPTLVAHVTIIIRSGDHGVAIEGRLEAGVRLLYPDNMSELPNFTLIAPPPHAAAATTPVSSVSLCQAWTRTIRTLPPELQTRFTVLEGTLSSLPADQLQCDCIVSPANAFGIMDGG